MIQSKVLHQLRFILICAFTCGSLFHSAAFGAGTLQLKGKLKAKDDTMFKLGDGINTYTIRKKGLAEDILKSIKKGRVGDTIELTIAFESIKEVSKDSK
jgi:hypothetical protein